MFHSQAIRRLILVFSLYAVILSLSGTPPRAAAQSTPLPNTGRDFLFAFSQLALQDAVGETWDEQQVYLLISAEAPATGMIDFTTPYLADIPFVTSIGNQVTVELPKLAGDSNPAAAPAGISDASIRITSDVDITLQALVYSPGNITDALLVPPTTAGNTLYMVPSYPSPAEYAEFHTNHAGFIVVAHEDNTEVNYLPRAEQPPAGDKTEVEELWLSGEPDYRAIETVTLDAGEVFLYQLKNLDPSGSIVESDKPVTVYGYAGCANVPVGSGPCDYLIESVPPVASWGTEYLIPPAELRTYQDTYRAYAWEDNTVITAFGTSQFATLQAGQYAEYRMRDNIPVALQSNKPFMLVRYFNSTYWDLMRGDPSMLIMAPPTAWLTSTQLTVPNIPDPDYLHGVAAIAPRGANITVNSEVLPALLWSQIPGTEFDYIWVLTDPDVYSAVSDQPFTVYVFGMRVAESYAYVSGYNYAPTWQPKSLLAEHLGAADAAAGPECRDETDIAVSPQFIDLAPGGQATVTVTMRNTGSVRAGSHDVLLSLSDGLSVVGSSSGVTNLGQRAALQNVILEPNETRSFDVTVQAATTLPTAPLHVTELYCQARVVERIDGVFLNPQPTVVEQPTTAPAVEPPAAVEAATPVPLPAVLPNTVGEQVDGWSVLLPTAVLISLILLFGLVLHLRRGR